MAKLDVRKSVDRALAKAEVSDIHTHLYAPCFGDLLSWGIDDLLTYHYLISEFFRATDLPYDAFWKLTKREQADAIWRALFVERTPVSEACRGVLTTLERLGLDARGKSLEKIRGWYAKQDREKHIDRVFEVAGVRDCVMTNDPFDDAERPVWLKGYRADDRFKAALRIDPVLLNWAKTFPRLADFGYKVSRELTPRTLGEVKRFLREWSERTKALYVGVSLPPTFNVPESSDAATLLEQAVVPVCEERNLPLAMMIGVKRQVNPQLRMAGDGVGLARIEPVEYLCAAFPKTKFMVTMLARENQHALCVAARKFRNLHVFGCWWFVNNPSLIAEITRERLELLGTGFTAQHSDARVIDQVIYKWAHSRKVIGDALVEKYQDLAATGWALSDDDIARDVSGLFGGHFRTFLDRKL